MCLKLNWTTYIAHKFYPLFKKKEKGLSEKKKKKKKKTQGFGLVAKTPLGFISSL